MHPSLRLSRRQALVLGGLGGLQALAPTAVRAQAPFPNRPIQFIVAAPAGGPSDNAARMIADEMGKLLGQPMVVVNKPGSAGVIAAEATARAAPDGHTLMLSWIGNATSPGLVAKLPFDINRDFVHIALALAGANALIVHPSTGFKTLADLVKHAKANPGRLSYASSGNGTSGHLAMEMFKQRAGISMLHIPYRGGAPALTDLMAGQVQLMFLNQDAVIAPSAAGKVVPLAISSAQRYPLLPQVPTVAETYPGYQSATWFGLFAPKGTPAALVQAIAQDTDKALKDPELRKSLLQQGITPVGEGPQVFVKQIKTEDVRVAQLVRRIGLSVE